MTYWYMQLSPDSEEWQNREEELLSEMKLIGGFFISDTLSKYFTEDMKINDIVLIKRGVKAIALVKVISEFISKQSETGIMNFSDLDWFEDRRKVRILDWASDEMLDFPIASSILDMATNKYTRAYSYIDNWYKKVQKKNLNFKIQEVFIESYKVLKNFKIDFFDENNKALALIVIAGKNGTGKTSLLEYLSNLKQGDKDCIKYQKNDKNYEFNKENTLNSKELESFRGNLVYIPTNIINTDKLEDLILGYIDYFVYEKGVSAFVGYENLQNDVYEIFEDFNLNFQFKRIDHKSKKPLFSNYDNVKDDIEFNLRDLSTGEKTLLSKVLYLYLNEVKNKVVLIDEPEFSLHPSWQAKILKVYENFAKSYNCQIIISTHSPHIIGSCKNEYIRVLRFNDENNVEVVDNKLSNEKDVNWVLEEIMGTDYLEGKSIINKIKEIENLLGKEQYLKADKKISNLEEKIARTDLDLIKLRNILDFEMD